MGSSLWCSLATILAVVMTTNASPLSPGPPKITQAPRDKKVAEEGTVSFFCKASGNPAPSFHWERVGKKINDRRNRYEITDRAHISVLRIRQVKAGRDNMTFTCAVNNGLGEARADATLKVYPRIGDVDDLPQTVKEEILGNTGSDSRECME